MDDNRAVDDQGANAVLYWTKSTVCRCVILKSIPPPQAGSMALLFPQMTNLGPGSLQRRSTMSIAGGDSFDLARELQLEEQLWK